MNIWKTFLSLLPSTPRLVGTIETVNIDDTMTVLLSGGGSLQVRGVGYLVGDKVFIKDDRIEGKAPSLPAYTVDV